MSMRSVPARAERATPSSRPRNLSELYVLVPRSPYSLSASEAIGTRTANAFRNPPTPLRVHNMQSASSSTPATIKRKHSEVTPNETESRDSDKIKGRGIYGTSKETAGHDKTQGYIFKHVKLTSCASSSHSLIFLDAHAALATAIVVGAVKPWVLSLPAKATPQPPAETLPKITWTPLPVPPSFTLDRALPRIAIREFALRFGRLLDMSRTHLEELEEIGGRRPHEVDDADSDSEQDIEVEMGWISETCLRAILLGLLNLLLTVKLKLVASEGRRQSRTPCKRSRRLVRTWVAFGAHLQTPCLLPSTQDYAPTRSGALNGAGVNVATTAQLVPVVLPLIEMMLDTQAVHDELEEGVKEARERVKEEKERAKAIREQWDLRKKNGKPGKAARAEYNRSLDALEQAQRVALHAHAPRFAPLGIDHEGRTYFALTPA
ncbi:hypothetical protein BJY52DRAFT_1213261 [Lactarius psammicola]|nr:hypothetical protein BJY52DRAFT_1213261 [Lactarius psammicola]